MLKSSKKKGMWMGGYVPLGYDCVERRLVINPAEAELLLYSNDPGFKRELKLPPGIAMQAVFPAIDGEPPDAVRTLVLLPGATVPGIGIQIGNAHGSRRIVRLDPMTGFPRVESVHTE